MILAIVGPTAVGKTKLSIELAKIYNGEIINCDSTQVYKGLDIGTAKVTKKEMEHIPHHLLSFKNIEDNYSVAEYQKDARACISDIQARNKIPIFVGGTGLYLKAALYDYEFEGEDLEDFNFYEDIKEEDLVARIDRYETGIVYDKKNIQRMKRLLAKLDSGWSPSSKQFRLMYPDVYFIGLTTDRSVLYEKINQRFDQMLVPLIDEVKPYILSNVSSKALHTAIGYKEFYPFFQNEKTLEAVVEECKKNIRNYAKRQYTWFLNQMDVTWFSVNYEDFSKTIQEVVRYID